MIDDSDRIRRLFEEIPSRFYEIKVEMNPMKDFKIRHHSDRFGTLHVEIPDYFEDAPDDVISDMARLILERRVGNNHCLREATLAWMFSDSRLDKWQPKFMRRWASCRDEGTFVDLKASAERVSTVVDIPPKTKICWVSYLGHNSGSVHPLPRVIMISDILDKDDVPCEVIDHVVAAHMMRLRETIGLSRESYPMAESAKWWLARRRINLVF